jgi:hypothetical protein
MLSGSRFIAVTLFSGMALLGQRSYLSSQEPVKSPAITAQALPEAPAPRVDVAAAAPFGEQTPAGQDQSTQQPAPSSAPAQSPAAQGSSSSQTPAGQPAAQENKHQQAAEQIKEEEHQRVLGIVPNFNLTYLGSQTVSMTATQKLTLAFHAATDPVAFVIPFFVTGYHEALDEDKGFPWGMRGLGERSGAAYLDSFDGNMIGNGILPAIFHQDPRYYRMGHGSVTRRALYSAATSFICKHDNTGKWEPNYSNVGGNIIGGALSNLYYPGSDSGVGLTISNGLIVTAEGAIGSEFDEFWPDVSRKLLHRDPTHGLDAQARAADEAKKRAQQGQQ